MSESLIETKILEHLHKKQLVSRIKSFFSVHFYNQFTSKGFLVKQTNNLWG